MAMAVAGFAHKLGLWVTAEGVASTVQLESAYRLGCDFFSGPLTGGYVDAETASALLGPVEAESSSAESTSAEEGSSEPVSV